MCNEDGRPPDQAESGRFSRVEYGIMICLTLIFLEHLTFPVLTPVATPLRQQLTNSAIFTGTAHRS